MMRHAAAVIAALSTVVAMPRVASAEVPPDPFYDFTLKCYAVTIYSSLIVSNDPKLKALMEAESKAVYRVLIRYGGFQGHSDHQIDADAEAVTKDRVHRLYQPNGFTDEGRKALEADYDDCVARGMIRLFVNDAGGP